VVHALGERHGGQLAAVGVDLVPRQLAQPALALPQPAAEPEDEHDGQGQVGHEEALGRVEAASDGGDGDVELQGEETKLARCLLRKGERLGLT